MVKKCGWIVKAEKIDAKVFAAAFYKKLLSPAVPQHGCCGKRGGGGTLKERRKRKYL